MGYGWLLVEKKRQIPKKIIKEERRDVKKSRRQFKTLLGR